MVVPILNPNTAEGLVKLAAALAGLRLEGESRHIRVVVLGVAVVPDDIPLSQGASLVKAYRTMLSYIPQNLDTHENFEIQTEVRVAREVWQGIADQVEDEKADLLLLHWKGSTQTPGKIYGSTIDALLAQPPCDMVLARFNNSLPPIKSILLPVRGGSYSTLALNLASNLAEEWQAGITVLHSLGRTGTTGPLSTRFPGFDNYYGPTFFDPAEDERLAALQDLLVELPAGARLITLQGKVIEGIAREAAYHDLVILGATETGSRLADGSEDVGSQRLAERLAGETNCAVLVVKTRKPFELTRPTIGIKPAAAVPREPALDELVDRWFAENIFNYREFRSMSSLTLLKERNNQSVSLVVPVYGAPHPAALADTIRRARYALMRDCALVDEIVVCAPDSQLEAEEVKAFYAHHGPGGPANADEIVYLNPTRSPHSTFEDSPSLSECLWYALQRTRGDIIVWADPTMAGFEARLIYGLVGPLLTYPEFQLATGFYSTDEGSAENSDLIYSNLVEMSLRPLLSGFQPLLAGVINPLCSVGAARRDFLERVPFITGPAFQIALLADAVQRDGLMSIAQIDLGLQPANHNPASPQRITADVMTVLLRRAEERSQGSLASKVHPSVKTIHKVGGIFSLKVEPPVSPQRELLPVSYVPGHKSHTF